MPEMGEKNSLGFFAELQRRNVYKVAIAYAVVAWLLIQIATQTFPFFEIPNWVVRTVISLLCLGFPVALLIAWAFELTPQGLKRTETAAEDAPRPAGRAWIYVAVIGALLSIGLFFAGRYSVPIKVSADLPEKSIAVLPFDNLSHDPENAYFAEGVQDEILTRLAKIADMKVISRTSTQRFKSSPNDLPAIARQLGVQHILEGSVQKSGGSVRVNVQLINALSDAHLWADTFDRKLTDIFAVESEIAQSIADTLQVKLSGREQKAIAARPTQNTEAYQLYLKGRFFWNKRTGADLKVALDYFQQAVAKDPSYAVAYAGVADACILIPAFSAGAGRDYFPQAKAAARRALELDEGLAEAHTALAQLYSVSDLNFEASTREFERAIQLNPNYATAHHWYGNSVLTATGRFDQAIAEMKRALELDPLSIIINADLGTTLIVARHYDEAIEALHRTIALDDKFAYAYWNLGECLYHKGDLPGAIAAYEKGVALDRDYLALGGLGRIYALAGEREKALTIERELKEASGHAYVPRFSLAMISIGLGDKAAAIQYLDQAYQNQETNDLIWLKVDPALDPLRAEPRFQELVAKIFPGNSP